MSKHGGKREGAGRPPKAEKKERMGVLFLSPAALAALQKRMGDGERWQDCIERLLLADERR